MLKFTPPSLALASALLAFSSESAQAETISFHDPQQDFRPSHESDLVLGAGTSSITARDLDFRPHSLRVQMSDDSADRPLGSGSLEVNARNAFLGSFSESIDLDSEAQNLSFLTSIDLSGQLVVDDGFSLLASKQTINSARLEEIVRLNAASIKIDGDSHGLSAMLSVEGSGVVPNALLQLEGTAETIDIEGGTGQAIQANGHGADASETEGTRILLEANSMTLSGGGSYAGGLYVDNAAVFASQGARVDLMGRTAGSELTITAKQVNAANPSNFFGNAALLSWGGSINLTYGESSRLTFKGGLVSWNGSGSSGLINVEIGEGSHTEVDGSLAALFADLNFKAKGPYRIEAPNIVAQHGTLTLDLDTSSAADGGIGQLVGLIQSSSGDATVDLRLTGERNSFTGVTMLASGNNRILMDLKNGASWNVEASSDEGFNDVTTLSLSGGTLNLGYGGADAGFKTVSADTLNGSGGTIRFNLELNASGEANDRLELGTLAEGRHTVHVEAHSGFEPVDMTGYLIKAGQEAAGSFTADSNKLEAGTFLYDYEVLSRAGDAPGETYWYLNFKESRPELTPSAEAAAAMAGMGAQTAMYLTQLSDVRQRIGEVRRGAREGLWASAGGSKDRIGGLAGAGFTQEAYRFNFGFDRRVDDWLLGFNVKAMTADQKTRGSQFRGDGDAHSEGVNAYATLTRPNGSYADFVLSFDRYHEDIQTRMLDGTAVQGGYRNFGFGVSAEIGHQFLFSGSWFVEPQMQLSYYRVQGDDFELSNGMKVRQKDFDGLTARLGLASGKEFRRTDGRLLGQLYGRLGVKHELLGEETIRINGLRFRDELLGTRLYYGIGGECMLAEDLKIFGHFEREEGPSYTKEFGFNVGLKYAF